MSAVAVSILVTAGLILFAISIHQIAETTERELTIRLNARLAWLSSSCRDPAIVGDFATIEQVLDEQSRLEDAGEISFRGTRGDPITRKGHPVTLAAPDWFVAWLRIPSFDGRRAIEVGGRGYGEVEIVLSPNRAINAAWKNMLTISLAAWTTLGAVILVILYFMRRQLQPLEELAATAVGFGKGDRSRRMDVRGVPEFRSVMLAFNDMADELSRQVTELTARAVELEQAKAAAESANLAKSRFLATMSHEIRTPMNGILGMAQMLLMPSIDEAERQDYARTILNSGQTLLILLNDILDLSKVEAGKLDLDLSAFEPAQILHETQALFLDAAHKQGLTFQAAWNGPTSARYRGDPHRLRQMLTNLVGNAIKFTQSGQVGIEAHEVERAGEECLLEFSVSDTGIGIPNDKQHLLFQPFSQTDNSTTRQYGGTGLGLSIVSSLANLMGGEVGVESQPGKGSRFWFRVRLGLIGKDEDTRESAREGNKVQPAERNSARLIGSVLVVEDNATNRKVIEAILARAGLVVTMAEDGQQCIDILQRGHPFDLVLMDIQMPVMDGYAATEWIRQWEAAGKRPRLPIVALTADAFEEDRKRCLAIGMNDFLAKPIAVEALQAVLRRWLKAGAEGLPVQSASPTHP
jgi:signal transduction histidine kinase/ActR/RegA family two-component response regulator